MFCSTCGSCPVPVVKVLIKTCGADFKNKDGQNSGGRRKKRVLRGIWLLELLRLTDEKRMRLLRYSSFEFIRYSC